MAVANGSVADTSFRQVAKWAPLAGRWRVTKNGAKYEGPDEGTAQFPASVLLASPKLLNGTITTTITLSRTEKTAAGIAFGFQSMTSQYLIGQIAGFNNAYSFAEYRPDFGFLRLSSAGSTVNLEAKVPLHVSLTVTGQSIRMTVDEVDVLNHVLTAPIESSGFGLYAWGDAAVEFGPTTYSALPPKIFVIMPFAEPYDTLYREVIKEVAENSGYTVVRVDEVTGPGMILDDIQQQIRESHAVVAEISNHNPNVFYELGYAHALRKPAVLLVRRQDGDKMPFDIRGYRAIFYDDSIGGKKNVERNLQQHLTAIQRERVA